jgi:hypothetical protein
VPSKVQLKKKKPKIHHIVPELFVKKTVILFATFVRSHLAIAQVCDPSILEAEAGGS